MPLYREWRAYYRLAPWDEQRADLRMAKIVCAILATHGVSTAPSEHMPYLDGPDEAQTVEEQQAIVARIQATIEAQRSHADGSEHSNR